MKFQITSIKGATGVHEATESRVKCRIGTEENSNVRQAIINGNVGMGASAGLGQRVYIENDLTNWTMKKGARFSMMAGGRGERGHGRVSAGGRGGRWAGTGKD